MQSKFDMRARCDIQSRFDMSARRDMQNKFDMRAICEMHSKFNILVRREMQSEPCLIVFNCIGLPGRTEAKVKVDDRFMVSKY